MAHLTVEKLTSDAMTLSENERTLPVHALLQSLEKTSDDDVEDAWEHEISQRVKSVPNGIAKGRPADDVFRDIRTKHAK